MAWSKYSEYDKYCLPCKCGCTMYAIDSVLMKLKLFWYNSSKIKWIKKDRLVRAGLNEATSPAHMLFMTLIQVHFKTCQLCYFLSPIHKQDTIQQMAECLWRSLRSWDLSVWTKVVNPTCRLCHLQGHTTRVDKKNRVANLNFNPPGTVSDASYWVASMTTQTTKRPTVIPQTWSTENQGKKRSSCATVVMLSEQQ